MRLVFKVIFKLEVCEKPSNAPVM